MFDIYSNNGLCFYFNNFIQSPPYSRLQVLIHDDFYPEYLFEPSSQGGRIRKKMNHTNKYKQSRRNKQEPNTYFDRWLLSYLMISFACYLRFRRLRILRDLYFLFLLELRLRRRRRRFEPPSTSSGGGGVSSSTSESYER